MSDAAPPTETEVTLARGLLAWKRMAEENDYGHPSDWEVYFWHGWKIEMNGSERYFEDEFAAAAARDACLAAHDLGADVLRRAAKAAPALRDDDAAPGRCVVAVRFDELGPRAAMRGIVREWGHGGLCSGPADGTGFCSKHADQCPKCRDYVGRCPVCGRSRPAPTEDQP